MSVTPFTIAIPQATLDDLRDRLSRTRWPDSITGGDWQFGTDPAYLKELVAYWQSGFDWRAQEAALNRFAQFRAEVDGVGIHFIHERGVGPKPLPLILSHGWPDSFVRMLKLIPLLTDPASHGGDPADAFDVVVPSLPGFGFSETLPEDESGERVAALWATLMTDMLGYARFGAGGGDIGSGITEELAFKHAASLVGIHLTDVPYTHIFTTPAEDLSEAEQAYLAAGQQWGMTEGGYAMMQSTRPWTLAYGLNDSPVGLAAWIVEKFRSWSDCDGDIEKRFTKDELLTNITLYWATATIATSFRPYYAGASDNDWDAGGESGDTGGADTRTEVPTGVAIFPKDIVPAPRAFAERFFNVQQWTEMPRGGHFAAMEEPELLVEDIRAFFRPLR